MPRWCWDLVDPQGQPCDGSQDRCAPAGRRCTDAELAAGKGCLAGQAPDTANPSKCVSAGAWSDSGVPARWPGGPAPVPPVPPLLTVVSPLVPPLLPLPAADDTFFCRDSPTAAVRFCTGAEAVACVRAPDGALPANPMCVHVGVPWVGAACPPGFVASAAAPSAGLPACVPDPAACGAGPYPPMPPGVAVVHVAALDGDDAAEGSTGSPVRTLGQALKRVGQGKAQAVAVAAGSYLESVVINGPVVVRGRCAAMTKLSGAAGIDTVTVTAGASGTIEFGGFRVAGPGRGVRVAGGGTVALRGLWIDGVQRAGLTVTAKATTVQFAESVIAAVQGSAAANEFGRGVVVEAGGALAAHDVRVSGCRDAGVFVSGSGSALTALGMLVDGTLANAADQTSGRGVRVRQGAKATLTQVRISGNRDLGLAAFDAGTTVAATGLLVDGTLPQASDKDWGYGLAVAGGAKVTLTGARLTANHSRGAAVQDATSTLELRAVVVDQTNPPAAVGASAAGVEATAGGTLVVEGLRVSGNRGFGIYIDGEGSQFSGTAALVDATKPYATSGAFGRGVQVQAGAQVTLAHARLTANHDAGFVVATKASATLSDAVVDGTLAQASDGRWGTGVHAGKGATLVLRRARLDGNTLVAWCRAARAPSSPRGRSLSMLPKRSRPMAWAGLALPVRRAANWISARPGSAATATPASRLPMPPPHCGPGAC